MSFISVTFFIYLGIALLLYHLLPLKYRWIILLCGSILFYLQGGLDILIYTALLALAAYFTALIIEKAGDGRKKAVTFGVILFTGVLCFSKIITYLQIKNILVPVGLSYYTLSIIGYLLDVYWGKDQAEHNFLYFMTFILYFPKILQGPISRHSFLGKSIIEGHRFDYKKFCFAVQLLMWGLFKKLVIADRLAILVSNVYGNLDGYRESGIVFVATMVMSAFQLYCDFSGYTDMAMGISGMFGIELEQNFNRPFMAKSAAEFWQRWHMSLSSWFKDYLFLPVSRTGAVKKLSKKIGSRFGAKYRKRSMMTVSAAVVWIATGLWHGTGINYLIWGIYWGIMIISSEWFSDVFGKLKTALKINADTFAWKLWQMVRTFMIFMVGRMISTQSNLAGVKLIAGSVVKRLNPGSISLLGAAGLSEYDWIVLGLSMAVLLVVSIFREKGTCIRQAIAGWKAPFRWILYCLGLTAIILLGVYGEGYSMSNFAYQFF